MKDCGFLNLPDLFSKNMRKKVKSEENIRGKIYLMIHEAREKIKK